MSKKYQKLVGDEETGDSKELDLTDTSTTAKVVSEVEMQTKTFSIKILLKEISVFF